MKYILLLLLVLQLPAKAQTWRLWMIDKNGTAKADSFYHKVGELDSVYKLVNNEYIAQKKPRKFYFPVGELTQGSVGGGGVSQQTLNDTAAALVARLQPIGSYAVTSHNHDGTYATTSHDHSGVYQPADADLTTYAGITPSANVQSILSSANYAEIKSLLSINNLDNTSDATKNSVSAALTNKDLTSGTNTFPTFNQNTTGSAATLTTPRLIDGQSFNGSADIQTQQDLLAYAALGSPILAETVGQKLFLANTSTNMVDNQIKYTAVYLPKAATLTGVKFYVRVAGNYTGDNNNRIGLYSYSAGTLTLVASSANNASLWTSGANAIKTIPFSSTYAASAGIYFVAFLYNNSAQTTAPALASGVALNNAAMSGTAFGFTNSAKLHGTSTGNDLPASIAMTGITASATPSWASLY